MSETQTILLIAILGFATVIALQIGILHELTRNRSGVSSAKERVRRK